MQTTKHIRHDFVRVYVCRAVTFGLDFCEKPTAPQSESRDSISEINEILRNKVNVLCANSPCGPKKVDLFFRGTHIINFADLQVPSFHLPSHWPHNARAERSMARHHPHPIAAMARAVTVVMLLVVVLVPAAATSGSVPVRKAPRASGRMLLAPLDVQPSAGFEDEYSPAASLDADASTSVEEPASEDGGTGTGTETEDEPDEKMKGLPETSLAVPSGEIENATAPEAKEGNATAGEGASVDESEESESKALVVVDADPVRRVTAKTKPTAAVAEEADAPAPAADVERDDDVADAPGPAQELSSDEETPAEAPEASHVNTTAEVSAPAPALWNATEDTPAADAPAASGLEPAAAPEAKGGNATAGDADGDDESSDAGDVDPAVEKKHEKKREQNEDETGDPGGVEEEDDAPAPAPEETAEEDSAEDAPAASQDPAPEPKEEDLLPPETPSPPPPVVGTISEYADDAESDVARAGRQDSREGVTPSWREAASTADARRGSGGSDDAVRLEVTVGNPESGESEFERAVPIALGGCALFVVGVVVYSRTSRRARGKTRGPASGAGKARATAGDSNWNENFNENWSDEEGWDELDEEAAAGEATDDRGKKRRAREAPRLSRIR